MARWPKIARGMLGMGLTFAGGVGVVASTIAALMWAFDGESAPAMIKMVVATSTWAFAIGVGFSGMLALTARTRSFDGLSLPRFALMGAGVGLFFFGLLATNAWQAWSLSQAIGNAVILTGLGGGSAAGALLLARRAGSPSEPGSNAALEDGSGAALGDGSKAALESGFDPVPERAEE
jgi:peptidoglycan/LPS O-acetylase OafA/YrhL